MSTQPTFSRAFLVVAWAGITSAIVGFVVCIYWMVWPYGGLILDPSKVVINTPVVTAGDLMTYSVHYCVDGDVPLPITVNREIEFQNNGDTQSFAVAPPIQYEITHRCETRHLVIGIPEYLKAGRYHLHAHVSLQVNPIRVKRQEFVSDDFQVVK